MQLLNANVQGTAPATLLAAYRAASSPTMAPPQPRQHHRGTAPARSQPLSGMQLADRQQRSVSVAALHGQPLSAAHHPCRCLVPSAISRSLLLVRDLYHATVYIITEQDDTFVFTRCMRFDRSFPDVTALRRSPEIVNCSVGMYCHITLVTGPHLRITELVVSGTDWMWPDLQVLCVLKISRMPCRTVVVRDGWCAVVAGGMPAGRHGGGAAPPRLPAPLQLLSPELLGHIFSFLPVAHKAQARPPQLGKQLSGSRSRTAPPQTVAEFLSAAWTVAMP